MTLVNSCFRTTIQMSHFRLCLQLKDRAQAKHLESKVLELDQESCFALQRHKEMIQNQLELDYL